MIGAIGLVGQRFGELQRLEGTTMINIIGPINVYRGDQATFRLTVTDDEDARVDITGATIELQVKTAKGDADPATIAKSVGSGITLLAQTGDTEGQADAVLLSADTDIAPGLRYLSVVIVIAGVRQTLVDREFVILPVVNAP